MLCRRMYHSWTKEQLIKRIKDLESLVPAAPLPQVASNTAGLVAEQPSETEAAKKPEKKSKTIDWSKFSTRKVALRFAYSGFEYSGLAIQDDPGIPTVELEIIKAMKKTLLVPSLDVADCDFSRCGRTDKGVSALRQVISLRVRSNLSADDQKLTEKDVQELDYLHILNQVLPDDIRFYEVCLHPPEDFDARFSCTYRHYKYLFVSDGLDIELMRQAARQFEGEHDFRNFCKVDGAKQITNFKRTMMHCDIEKLPTFGSNVYCLDLKGTAFLWHQVRSMMAVLFMVGQGLESPDVVYQLLDVEKVPRRPVYQMAADTPLILYDCGFPDNVEWRSFKLKDSARRLDDKIYDIWHHAAMKFYVTQMIRDVVSQSYQEEELERKQNINDGSGRGKVQRSYTKLLDRQTLEPPEVVNERWLQKRHSRRV